MYGAAIITALVLVWFAAEPASAQTAPRRVVSANLCADQLLLSLADPDQIVSLSPFATDRHLSYLVDEAQSFAQNRGSVEDVIQLGADLVLLGAYDNRYARALLEARTIPYVIVEPWQSLDHGKRQIRELAVRLAHVERGETLVRRIDDALARAHNATPVGRTALVIERRGFVVGQGSLIHEVLAAAGLRDGAEAVGIHTQGFVSLERLVAGGPDYLVVSDGDVGASDQGQAFLVHPALQTLYPAARRLTVPDRLAVCGGPATADLIDHITGQIRAKVK